MSASTSTAERVLTTERLTGAARLAELSGIKARRKRTDKAIETVRHVPLLRSYTTWMTRN